VGEPCEFHAEMVKARENLEKKAEQHDVAIEGKVSKGSIKWVAAIFALPAVVAGLGLYAFIQSADYKFGSAQQALANQANIRLLDERTINMKSDMVTLQSNMNTSVSKIERTIEEMDKKLDRFMNRHERE
jgi:uncharacterized protein HemX